MKDGGAVVEPSHDGVLQMIEQSQDGLIKGIEFWAELTKSFIPKGSWSPFPQLAFAGGLVETCVQFGDRLLTTQREFIRWVFSDAEGDSPVPPAGRASARAAS